MTDFLILAAVKAIKFVALGIAALASCVGHCGTAPDPAALASPPAPGPIVVVPIGLVESPVEIVAPEPVPEPEPVVVVTVRHLPTVPEVEAEAGVIPVEPVIRLAPPIRIETILAPDLLVPPKARDVAF